MSLNDPISDMVARIQNASMAKLNITNCIYSKLNENALEILKKEGYIENFSVIDITNRKQILKVELRYVGKAKESAIKIIKRISTPGRKIYKGVKELSEGYKKGLGTTILTTNNGVKTDHQCVKEKLGGKILFKIF